MENVFLPHQKFPHCFNFVVQKYRNKFWFIAILVFEGVSNEEAENES